MENSSLTLPRKRFGQHFLHDENIINRIVDLIDSNTFEEPVIEIGPGRGAITFPLLEKISPLHVVEIDRDLITQLKKRESDPEKLIIHESDALKFNFSMNQTGKAIIIGNLPYNISTPLLFHLMNQLNGIKEMIFMVQKEVADRICAVSGNKTYGRLSIMVQAYCAVENLFDVDATSFTPAPKVQSTVIRLQPLVNNAIHIENKKQFADIVRIAFSHRRKTLRNALKEIITEDVFDKTSINPTSRPEQLDVQSFIRLANASKQQ